MATSGSFCNPSYTNLNFSSDELSGLELWLNIDKKTSEEIEDSIWELPELFDYIPNSD